MSNIIMKVAETGLVPLITIDRPEDALRIGEALLEGGLPVAEVTFRTDAAEKAIALLSRELPELTLGAGTVLRTEQADRAANAGARFCVSPGCNPKVIAHCIRIGLPIAPGVCTPSDIEAALEFNLDVLKFFPAETMGGLKNLKAVSAPYGKVKFIPTGGISAKNLPEYLSFDRVIACGGSWIAPGDLIAAGNFSQITTLAREAVQIVKSARARS